VRAHFPSKKPEGRMVALVGDAEMDEGNIFEAMLEGWKHGLRNCWWVIDYNRQSLDATTPDRRMMLDAELAPDLRHMSGKVQIVPKNDAAQAERLDWQWLDEGRIRSRLYSRASNGREFLNQELICKRAGDPAAIAAD
jgi:hypothetical protein